MKKMRIAVQVYSVRDEAAADFKGTMEKIKEMGYDGVELAGLYDLEPQTIRDILAENGLEAVSAHVPYQELIADMSGTVEKYSVIGCSYIAIPYMVEEHRPGGASYDGVEDSLRQIGALCIEKGMKLLYHNHDFEFEKVPDGRYALDYLYETIPSDLLETEVDTCWVKVAGVDPAAYIKKYAGRAPIVHLKDFHGSKSAGMYELIGLEGEKEKSSDAFEFRAVGDGVQDFEAILQAASEAGADWVVVEQDSHTAYTPMEDIKRSIDYLKNLGL